MSLQHVEQIKQLEAISKDQGGFVTANQVASREFSNDVFLLEPLFVKGELNILMGSSDTGKSTFLRNLADAISLRKSTYGGCPLSVKTGKTLIVSMEDGEWAVNRYYNSFRKELVTHEALDNIHFVFDFDQSIMECLRGLVKLHSYDAILIDSYSDVYEGRSANDQAETRSFMKAFSRLAKDTGASVIFLHHLNKAAKDYLVTKNDSLGSGAIEQKSRSVVHMRKVKGYQNNQRALRIVKGNYAPSEAKQNELILNFNEEQLDLEFVDWKAFSSIEPSKPKYSEDLKKEIIAFCTELLERQSKISSRKLVRSVKGKFGKSPSHTTLMNWLGK